MKKPDRVEVGQWWTEDDDGSPVLITAIEEPSTCNNAGEWARYADGAVPCGSLLYSGTYLGSGEHPEPSEWMIETLAAHYWVVRHGDCPSGMKEQTLRAMRMAVMSGNEPMTTPDAAVMSLYNILRSLGKW